MERVESAYFHKGTSSYVLQNQKDEIDYIQCSCLDAHIHTVKYREKGVVLGPMWEKKINFPLHF